ncbi:copia protein, partial [Trifolium medium]|nr:copia protein [Trifolium medium]
MTRKEMIADLMGPMQVKNLGGKRYVFVVVDDFSKFTWMNFIKEKSHTFNGLKDLCRHLEREKEGVIVRIRSDHGKEFENAKFSDFCSSEGISHEFSSTLYELWKGRKPIVKYFHVFGSKCYILANREQRRKMDPKSDEGRFLGYSTNSRAYRVFNSRTK